MKAIKKTMVSCKKAVIRLLDDCIAMEEVNIVEAKRRKKKYHAKKRELEREVEKDVVESD